MGVEVKGTLDIEYSEASAASLSLVLSNYLNSSEQSHLEGGTSRHKINNILDHYGFTNYLNACGEDGQVLQSFYFDGKWNFENELEAFLKLLAGYQVNIEGTFSGDTDYSGEDDDYDEALETWSWQYRVKNSTLQKLASF